MIHSVDTPFVPFSKNRFKKRKEKEEKGFKIYLC